MKLTGYQNTMQEFIAIGNGEMLQYNPLFIYNTFAIRRLPEGTL